MAKDEMKFSRPKPEMFQITPLGAAIVEAMPDEDKKRRVKRNFKRKSECPVSMIFDAKSLESYYRKRGEKIKAVQPPDHGDTER